MNDIALFSNILFFSFPNSDDSNKKQPQEKKNNSSFPQWQNKERKNSNEKDDTQENKKRAGSNIPLLIVFILGVIFTISFFVNNTQLTNTNEVSYSQFLQYLDNGEIVSVSIVEEKEVVGVKNDGTRFNTRIPYYDGNLLVLLQSKNVSLTGTTRPVTFLQIFSTALPWLVSVLFIFYMLRNIRRLGGGSGLPFTKSRVRAYVQTQESKVTFNDVAGQDEAKDELKEVVEFLKEPDKFQYIGAKIPRGVLLVGSPGTGKTLLAKACAGEAEVKFFYMSGSDFVEMFAGVGASRARELFEQARKNAPCIVFIDELDAIGRSRSSSIGGGANDEREQTLNQLLVEMDGFETRDRIIVLAATNRPDVLDHALLRPGRFDRQVVVDMPDMKERELILAIHAKNVKLSKNVNINQVARATVGCSGADLANLINESALLAAREGKKEVEMEDMEEARDKILMGAARKSKVITAEDKLKTARHEAGHSLLHFLLKNADPLHKVTIIPRGRALGVAFSLPEKDSYGKGHAYLLDRISICYGGFIAERMYYNETSTGVQNDLEQATNIATKMVRDWGMSELGPISFSERQTSLFLPIDNPSGNVFSNETSRDIDKEIHKILDKGFQEARAILESHKKELDIISDELIKKETLLGEQVAIIVKDCAQERAEEKEKVPEDA